MNATNLYSQIKSYSNLDETQICVLHKPKPNTPCINNPCSNPSQTKVVDFDKVKSIFCRLNNQPQLASVDCITHKGDNFLFVEIKSNKNFLTHQLKSSNAEAEDDEIIKSKVAGYNLKKKISDSILICNKISGNTNVFESIPCIYVLVTDTNTIEDPAQRFLANMNILAYNSIDIRKLTKLNKVLRENLESLGYTNRYVKCSDFDDYIRNLVVSDLHSETLEYQHL